MKKEDVILNAKLYSAVEPSKEQQKRFGNFLKNKYGQELSLEWVKSDAFPGGFRLTSDIELFII